MLPKNPIVPSDVPAEERFDLAVLTLAGPWRDFELTDAPPERNLSVRFKSTEDYLNTFLKLITEECSAMMRISWEELSKKRSSEKQVAGMKEKRFFSCHVTVYCQGVGEAFCYLEVKQVNGVRASLDVGQALLLRAANNTMAIAIVNTTLKNMIILRTGAKSNLGNGQYDIWILDNLTTMKRTYISVCCLRTFSYPLKLQILDPMVNSEYVSWLQVSDECEQALSEWCSWQLLANFNRQQMLAIVAVLRLKQGFLLVQGPPGTGKTTTITGIISATLNDNAQARVLVCAPSNAAVDEVGGRLMKGMYGKDGQKYIPKKGCIVRSGPKGSIKSACREITAEGILSPNTQNWQDAEKQMLRSASVLCTTLSCCGHWLLDELNMKFDLVIVDEAVQATEAEIMIAVNRAKGRCVLIGDPCQLPATVFQQPACAYTRSLFERFQECGMNPLLLDTQYRMHELISSFPSREFYGGALKDSLQVKEMKGIFNEEKNDMMTVEGYQFKISSYTFMDIKWGMDEVGENKSRFNNDEAKVIKAVVGGILRKVKKEVKVEIGIITPYATQKDVILSHLNGVERSLCEVNTIDGFQGREKDIIIISCVRAGKGIGFVSDKRRVNVALTRAKYALIVVGNAETLERECKMWGRLIQDARSRGVYQILSSQQKQAQNHHLKPRKSKTKRKCHHSSSQSSKRPNLL